jgi:hypothetical protein
MPRFPQRVWLAAFLVAWSVDLLFWAKPVGISFLIFVVGALTAGFLLTYFEKVKPAPPNLILAGAVVILAGATLVRSEPLTRLINAFLALVGLALLVRTFQSGGWIRFRMLSYAALWLDLFVAGLVRAAGLPLAPKNDQQGAWRSGIRSALPWLRGVLLALPLVILLAALLSSADLIFADQLNGLLKNFDLRNLPEYLLRFFFILIMTYVFASYYLQALLPSGWVIDLPGDPRKPGVAKPAPLVPADAAEPQREENLAPTAALQPVSLRFLGATEAFIILGSVDLLFAFFLVVQFRYLFGGQANITVAGYTFSEYARRGFFELVSVAVISLFIYLTLNAVTRRSKAITEQAFIGLSTLLVGQVLVILVSAFQRLLLYENAYGFSRLRTYTHIFIPWLGALLVITILLQVLRRDQYFGAALLGVVLGFALSFAVLNVDGLIVRQNVARAQAGTNLDGAYLINLSDDALPDLVSEYQHPGQPEAVREVLGGVLACRIYRNSLDQALPWQSYHPGSVAARQRLAGVDLSGFTVETGDDRGAFVELSSGPFQCYQSSEFD